MPSRAYTTFNYNLKQVDRLLQAFIDMRPPQKSRKHLDHFTRAALLFLCSSWEVYIEQVVNEAGKIISEKVASPSSMPMPIQKTISSAVKADKHELSPISFATNWQEFYLIQINVYTSKLNTPKKDNVMELLNKYVGIPGDRITAEVPSLTKINKIVTDRGNIAHNIYADEYLKKDTVDGYYNVIKQLVKEIELLLWDYLPEVTDRKRPWQNTY